MHNPAKVAIRRIKKSIRHVLFSQSRRIERQRQINAFHKGTKFGDGFGGCAVPLKRVHRAWGADASAELRVGVKDGFGLPFLSNKNHGDIALINDIFEEIRHSIEHALGVSVENMLEFVNEDHANLTTF